MPFTVSQVKDLAESYLSETFMDETIDGANAIRWVNECLRLHVTGKAWLETSHNYDNAVTGTWYDLPADFIRSVDVTLGSAPYTTHTIRSRRIKFQHDGDYTLNYVYHPTAVTTVSANLPLQEIFMYPMAKFVLSKHLGTDPDRKQVAEQAMAEFQIELKALFGDVEFSDEPFQVKEVW